MKKRVLIYWLLPAEPYRKLLGQLIRILAKEFDAPRFEPHLTLGSTKTMVLPRIALPSVRLAIHEIAWSPKFTKTVFVRFRPNESITELAKKIAARGNALQDPHLSLIYKDLPVTVKGEIAKTIRLPFREVVFDRLRLMSCVTPVKSAREVEAWQSLTTKRLS